MDAEEKAELLANANAMYAEAVPHVRALGITAVDFGPDFVVLRLPYAEHLVGNPATGVLHGGVVTSLIDTACGASVVVRLERLVRIATLDLRLDYLRPAKPKHELFARAECYRLTKQIAFVRAVAFQDTPDEPVASANGTFILVEG